MLKQGQLLFILVCLCLNTGTALAQQNDSIRALEKSLVDKLPDTVRLKTLIRLSDLCMANNSAIKKGEVYISKAMELARDKNLPVPYRLHLLNAMIFRSHDMP